MFLFGQILVYLIIALLVGGALGYIFRSCQSETFHFLHGDGETAEASVVLSDTVSKEASFDVHEPIEVDAGQSPWRNLDPRQLELVLLAAAPGVELHKQETLDDLTKIHGLNAEAALWLNEKGIKTFAKLASLSAGELYWIVENLPSSGRSLYADNWPAQAAKLAEA